MKIAKLRLMNRIADLEWKVEHLHREVGDLIRKKAAFTLEPSPPPRKKMVFKAPLCGGTYESTGHPCTRHTVDSSGYCVTHRKGVTGSNGIPTPVVQN